VNAPVLWPQGDRAGTELRLFVWPICISISLFRLPSLVSATPRHLNIPYLLQYITGHLKRHYLRFWRDIMHRSFNADLHSRSAAGSSKPIEGMSEALLRRCQQYQTVCKKYTVGPAVLNSDTLVDSAVTVYPISWRLWKPGRNHTENSPALVKLCRGIFF